MITGFSVLNLKYKSQKNSDRQKQKPYHCTYNNLIIKCIFNKNLININPALFFKKKKGPEIHNFRFRPV